MWTYAYLAILVLVFLLTDLAKYKPVIVLEGFAYIATWVTYLQYLQYLYLSVNIYRIYNILRCCCSGGAGWGRCS